MAKPPYRLARQEHLGEMLDELRTRKELDWRWDYDEPKRRAIFNVQLTGGPWRAFRHAISGEARNRGNPAVLPSEERGSEPSEERGEHY